MEPCDAEFAPEPSDTEGLDLGGWCLEARKDLGISKPAQDAQIENSEDTKHEKQRILGDSTISQTGEAGESVNHFGLQTSQVSWICNPHAKLQDFLRWSVSSKGYPDFYGFSSCHVHVTHKKYWQGLYRTRFCRIKHEDYQSSPHTNDLKNR